MRFYVSRRRDFNRSAVFPKYQVTRMVSHLGFGPFGIALVNLQTGLWSYEQSLCIPLQGHLHLQLQLPRHV